MKAHLRWTEGMKLSAESAENSVMMDAKSPMGQGQAMTPKELVAAGLGGCTAMDVLALFKKHKQPFESFEVIVDITPSTAGYPVVFESAVISFIAQGQIDKNIYIDAVKLSQTKYCGVSAMLAKALPIKYIVILNGEKINEGTAHFEN
jgi:putative redox protein